MAGNKHPWRDVMSKNAWDTMRDRTNAKHTDIKARDPLGEIEKQLDEYHKIPKQDRKKFPKRIKALIVLAIEANKYLEAKYKQQSYQRTGNHKGIVQSENRLVKNNNNNNNNMENTIDRWVYSLAKRAVKKAGYLEDLYRHLIGDRGHLGSASAFLNYVQNKRESPYESRLTPGLLNLVPGVKPEKWDPFHRPIEVEIDEELRTRVTHPNAISHAFSEWCNSNNEIHFLEWLEDHSICRITKYLDETGTRNMPNPLGFGRVQYGLTNTMIQSTYPKNGKLHAKTLGKEEVESLLTTINKFVKRKPGQAYVWLNTGEILIGKHEVGVFHHSSFFSGGKVRCAGTMEAEDGIVTRLDNYSGHYRPTAQHVLTFLQFLHKHNVLGPSAKISAYGTHGVENLENLDWSEFLKQTQDKGLKSFPLPSSF